MSAFKTIPQLKELAKSTRHWATAGNRSETMRTLQSNWREGRGPKKSANESHRSRQRQCKIKTKDKTDNNGLSHKELTQP